MNAYNRFEACRYGYGGTLADVVRKAAERWATG